MCYLLMYLLDCTILYCTGTTISKLLPEHSFRNSTTINHINDAEMLHSVMEHNNLSIDQYDSNNNSVNTIVHLPTQHTTHDGTINTNISTLSQPPQADTLIPGDNDSINVTTTTTSTTIVSDADRNQLIDYLSNCSLFSESSDGLQVEADELDELIMRCDGVNNLINQLKQLDKSNEKFTTIPELRRIIDPSESINTTQISDSDRQRMIDYLGECNLFSNTNELSVDQADIDNCIIAGNGINNTINTCKQLDSQNEKFHTLQQLTAQLAGAIIDPDDQLSPKRDTVISYLGECGLFSQSTTDLEVTIEGLNSLIAACGTADTLIASLQQLDNQQRKFTQFNELLPAIHQLHEPYLQPVESTQRQSLIEYLSDASFQVFSEVSGDVEISEDELDSLILYGVTVSQLIIQLKHLSDQNVKLSAFNMLLPALQQQAQHSLQNHHAPLDNSVHNNTVNDPNQPIIQSSTHIQPVIASADVVTAAAGTTSTAPDQTNNSTITSSPADLKYSADESQQLIVNYLSSDECLLFSDASDGLEVNEDDMSNMITMCGDGVNAVKHMTLFNQLQRKFSSFVELYTAMKQSIQSMTYLSQQQSELIIDYLQCDTTQLFAAAGDSLTIEANDLDALVLACRGNVQYTIELCEQLNQQNKSYYTFQQLVDDIKTIPINI